MYRPDKIHVDFLKMLCDENIKWLTAIYDNGDINDGLKLDDKTGTQRVLRLENCKTYEASS